VKRIALRKRRSGAVSRRSAVVAQHSDERVVPDGRIFVVGAAGSRPWSLYSPSSAPAGVAEAWPSICLQTLSQSVAIWRWASAKFMAPAQTWRCR